MAKIDSYFRSDIGRMRTNNEDASGAFEPRENREMNQSGQLYVVADGMGGHELGEMASTLAVESLLKAYNEAPRAPIEKRLRDIIQRINQSLIKYAEIHLKNGERTGTTLLAAVVRRGRLWIANVGDSRAYFLRDGRIQQITRDHSLVAELARAGTITEEEALNSKYRNRLSRSVGIDPKLEVDIYPAIPLQRGDIILLCTDGLTQYASSEDILNAAHGSAKEITERLILFANERGGSDNITVSVIKYEKETVPPFNLPLKRLALMGMSIITLGAFSILAWVVLSRWAPVLAVPTPTASAASTVSPIPTTWSSLTSAPEITEAVPPAEDATLTQTEFPAASPITSLVDCEYTVVAGDYAVKIADTFGTTLDQVFRQDDTQENMSAITPGEMLFIKGVSAEVCTNGGGVPSGPTAIP